MNVQPTGYAENICEPNFRDQLGMVVIMQEGVMGNETTNGKNIRKVTGRDTANSDR